MHLAFSVSCMPPSCVLFFVSVPCAKCTVACFVSRVPCLSFRVSCFVSQVSPVVCLAPRVCVRLVPDISRLVKLTCPVLLVSCLISQDSRVLVLVHRVPVSRASCASHVVSRARLVLAVSRLCLVSRAKRFMLRASCFVSGVLCSCLVCHVRVSRRVTRVTRTASQPLCLACRVSRLVPRPVGRPSSVCRPSARGAPVASDRPGAPQNHDELTESC